MTRTNWTRSLAGIACTAATAATLFAGLLAPLVARADANPASATGPSFSSIGSDTTSFSAVAGGVSTTTAAQPAGLGRWQVAATPRVAAHIYQYDGSQATSTDAAAAAATWDAALSDVLTTLGAPAGTRLNPIDGYLYPDSQSFMLKTGDTRAIEGVALISKGEFHVINRADANVTIHHELTHLVAAQLNGKAGTTALDEGLAVAVAGWSTSDLNLQAASLQASGNLVTITSLLNDFQSQPGAISYPEVGSFVRYLLTQGDLATFTQMYQSSNPASSAPALYGRSIDTLEMQWRSSLATL